MSTKPASANTNERLAPGQVIGLFLARLLAYLMRLETSGGAIVRSDIGQLVASAEGLVQSYIRMRASEQLESAGFSDAAHAMRTTTRICSREPAVHTERSRSCKHASPAELIARLRPALEQFERADAMAEKLARIILCALCVLTPEERKDPSFGLNTRISDSRSTSPIKNELAPWPPPLRLVFSADPQTPAQAGVHTLNLATLERLEAWIPACAGIGGKNL